MTDFNEQTTLDKIQTPKDENFRGFPLDLNAEQFRALGYQAVDWIAGLLRELPTLPVTRGETVAQVREALGENNLPTVGIPPHEALQEAWTLLQTHSLFSGHPRFLAYMNPPAAPIGALGDLIAAAINPNVGAWLLSPMATEMETQTVRWIAELIGYPADCGGVMVSGGTVANWVGLLAARRALAPWDVRTAGVHRTGKGRLLMYSSDQAHSWLQKAADLSGFGTEAIRWIPTHPDLRLDVACLQEQIERDLREGHTPFLVIGTAGTVSTGVVDPLVAMAQLCRHYGLWFHVDGAYGAFAAALPDASADLKGLALADSVAVDPHKWLYTPLDVGCSLVRRPENLQATFQYRPSYYRFEGKEGEQLLNYYEYGPQNSRGFRALKVWLGLRHLGREGIIQSIQRDIHLARELYRLVNEYPSLQPGTQNLSVATFRYIPSDFDPNNVQNRDYLNALNAKVLDKLQRSGTAYLSNAVVHGNFLLRAAVLNFRTSNKDLRAILECITQLGADTHAEMRHSSR